MADGIKRVFRTDLDSVTSTDKEGVGTLRFEGDKVYKWVELLNNKSTDVSCSSGNILCYAGPPAGYIRNRVCSDVTAAATIPIGAGVVATTETVPGIQLTLYYLWIQVSGEAQVVYNGGAGGTMPSASPGKLLKASATDLELEVITAYSDPVCAMYMDPEYGGVPSYFHIQCRFFW